MFFCCKRSLLFKVNCNRPIQSLISVTTTKEGTMSETLEQARLRLERSRMGHTMLCPYDPDEYCDECTCGALEVNTAIEQAKRAV